MGRNDKSADLVVDESGFYHRFLVEIAIFGKKKTVVMPTDNAEDFFIRNTPGHKVGLGFNRNAASRQALDDAVAGEIFIQNEGQAARRSISQRRASSTAFISRS